jgi:hypothetical protein
MRYKATTAEFHRRWWQVINYRAVLIEWYLEELGDNRSIYVAKDSVKLFNKIKESIFSHIDLVLDFHWEYIDDADLWEYFNDLDRYEVNSMFCDAPYPEDDWTQEDLRLLLKYLMEKRQNELVNNPDDKSILGEWNNLIEWINGNFTYDRDDGVFIPIEGNLIKFVNELLKNELIGFRFKIDQFHRRGGFTSKAGLDQIAQWIGWLATLTDEERWNKWNERQSYKLMLNLIDEFNEMYGFC